MASSPYHIDYGQAPAQLGQSNICCAATYIIEGENMCSSNQNIFQDNLKDLLTKTYSECFTGFNSVQSEMLS